MLSPCVLYHHVALLQQWNDHHVQVVGNFAPAMEKQHAEGACLRHPASMPCSKHPSRQQLDDAVTLASSVSAAPPYRQMWRHSFGFEYHIQHASFPPGPPSILACFPACQSGVCLILPGQACIAWHSTENQFSRVAGKFAVAVGAPLLT